MAGSVVFSVAPYHILSYGALLGTSLFHSFINGPVMFKTVDRPSFSAVQTKLFPIYFGLQTALSSIVALTLPGNTLAGIPSGISGLLDASRRWNTLAPIAVMFLTSFVNFTLLLPATNKLIKERHGQGKRDGKSWYAEGPHTEQMRALNKRFGMVHGISYLINIATFISTVAYGFTLGARLQSLADRL